MEPLNGSTTQLQHLEVEKPSKTTVIKTTIYIVTLWTSLLLSTTALAGSSSSALSEAIILEPASIVKIADLDFGYINAGATAGTVVINYTNGARTKTGGVSFAAVAGPVSRAVFTVTSKKKYKVSVSTSPITLTREGGTETMTVQSFTYNTGQINANVTTIYVGATLNVGANQAAGEYRSLQTFNVNVNFP